MGTNSSVVYRRCWGMLAGQGVKDHPMYNLLPLTISLQDLSSEKKYSANIDLYIPDSKGDHHLVLLVN